MQGERGRRGLYAASRGFPAALNDAATHPIVLKKESNKYTTPVPRATTDPTEQPRGTPAHKQEKVSEACEKQRHICRWPTSPPGGGLCTVGRQKSISGLKAPCTPFRTRKLETRWEASRHNVSVTVNVARALAKMSQRSVPASACVHKLTTACDPPWQ